MSPCSGDIPLFADSVVSGLDGGIVHGARYAQQVIGIAGIEAEVAFADAGEIRFVEAEDAGNAAQEIEFFVRYLAIRLGDMEKAVDQFLQHPGFAREHVGDLAGIGLETMGVAPRLVEDPTDVLFLLRGYLEDLFECQYLGAVDDPVRLCHFGTQYDDSDGEGDLTGGGAFVD